jgi:DNA-binding HxlR family transcriptional regulator
VLTTLVNRGKFKISELPFDSSSRSTVRRTLREMEEKGWLARESEHAHVYRLGPKGELLLDVSQETIEQSTS